MKVIVVILYNSINSIIKSGVSMRIYNYSERWKDLLQPDVVAMLTQIHEHKGKQDQLLVTESDTLEKLVDIAKIQSTDASNRIEGIYTSDERLKKIVLDKTRPKNRNEEEIAGYRNVLSIIHDNYMSIPLKSSMILQLHRDLYRFSGRSIGGSYKIADNVISEEDTEGNKFIRFQPLAAWQTPEAMESICAAFDSAVTLQEADPLLLIPMFILDFLCIHPFSDGNGRMSRLLTLLLLYRSNFLVGKYISIEKQIELSKETYYEALYSSSAGWHENKNDYIPFVRYTLGVILSAYREFADRAKLLQKSDYSKPDRIREIIKGTLGKITKSEIKEECPDISEVTIQRTLKQLLDSGEILKLGGGRYTAYIWNRENEK